MMILAGSAEYIQIPLKGPAADLTIYPVSIALMPDNGTEPGAGDWHAAVWLANSTGVPEPSVLSSLWGAGMWMAFVKITAAPETVTLRAGRVRIGDTRT